MVNVSLQEKYSCVQDHYTKACTKFIPLLRPPNTGKTRPKWMNPDVKKSSRLKFSVFCKLNDCPKAIQYHLTPYQKKIRDAVIQYEKVIVDNSKKDPKLLYVNSQKKFKTPIKALQDSRVLSSQIP